jgi:cobalamin biosynthesis Mg chelatase CobN
MKTLRTRLVLSLTAIAAIAATPAAAAQVEEAVVPPSNSAATQYTETFPTTGGDKKTDQKPNPRSPAKVLGSHNTQKLEKQGPEGKAAAEAAAATAPTSISTPPPANSPSNQSTGYDGDNQQGGGAAGSNDKGSGNGSGNAKSQGSGVASGSEPAHPAATEPAGSSGIGSTIGQATGLSTSGQSGLLLPLVILATIIWSLAYFWRQRRQLG